MNIYGGVNTLVHEVENLSLGLRVFTYVGHVATACHCVTIINLSCQSFPAMTFC